MSCPNCGCATAEPIGGCPACGYGCESPEVEKPCGRCRWDNHVSMCSVCSDTVCDDCKVGDECCGCYLTEHPGVPFIVSYKGPWGVMWNRGGKDKDAVLDEELFGTRRKAVFFAVKMCTGVEYSVWCEALGAVEKLLQAEPNAAIGELVKLMRGWMEVEVASEVSEVSDHAALLVKRLAS